MKRILTWLIVVLMAIAGSISAMADESVPEVPPAEKKPNAGYKGGFFIQNDDGSFQFKIQGRIQPKLHYEKTTDQKGKFTFSLRRARVDFKATVAEKAKFQISLNHSTSSAKFQTLNMIIAIAAYEFDPAFTVTAGTVGLPLSIVGGGSSLGYVLLEAPLVQTQDDAGTITPARSAFGNPDGLGVQFNGDIGKFFYEASIVNGAAETTLTKPAATVSGATIPAVAGSGGVESNYDLNFNRRVSLGARVGWHILEAAADGNEMDLNYSEKPALTVSAGANYQGRRQDPVTAVVLKRILTGSAGAAFKWRGLAVNGEVYGRKTTLDTPGTTTWFATTMDDFGYYLDGGYFVIPKKLEVAAGAGQIFRQGPHNNSYQTGGALNYYVKGNNLKFQLGYTLSGSYSDITNAQVTKIHTLGTMMTVSF